MISSINEWRRSSNIGGFGASSRRFLNNFIKNSNEYWYIGSINARSAITKYNTDPRLATPRYNSLAESIS